MSDRKIVSHLDLHDFCGCDEVYVVWSDGQHEYLTRELFDELVADGRYQC